MTMPEAKEPVRFYFSFRSPYAWLAALRIEHALARLPVQLHYLPVFPPPDYPNDPTAVPNKRKYIEQDMLRVAEAYGLRAVAPTKLDCEWVRPHAAFLYAADCGKGREFLVSLYAARFMHDQDVGDDSVLASVARELGLDAALLVRAASDEAYQTRVVLGMIQGATEDFIFGVPYFVYRGETFWGNDRIDWLVRTIRRAHGMPVVDLSQDFMRALDR